MKSCLPRIDACLVSFFAQANYAQYHAEVFDIDGNFLADKWADWDGPKARCPPAPEGLGRVGPAVCFWKAFSKESACSSISFTELSEGKALWHGTLQSEVHCQHHFPLDYQEGFRVRDEGSAWGLLQLQFSSHATVVRFQYKMRPNCIFHAGRETAAV